MRFILFDVIVPHFEKQVVCWGWCQ